MLTNCKEKYTNFNDKGLLWYVPKCEIRVASISYASWKAKQFRENGLILEKKLKGLADIINDSDVTALQKYKETKQSFLRKK